MGTGHLCYFCNFTVVGYDISLVYSLYEKEDYNEKGYNHRAGPAFRDRMYGTD